MRYFLVSYVVVCNDNQFICGHVITITSRRLFVNYEKFTKDVTESLKKKDKKLSVAKPTILNIYEYKNKKDMEIFNRKESQELK